jgi:hypothetical protein
MPHRTNRPNIKPNTPNTAFVRRGLLQTAEIVGVGNQSLLTQHGLSGVWPFGKTFSSLVWLRDHPIPGANICRIHRVLEGPTGAKTSIFCDTRRIFILQRFSETFHLKLPLVYIFEYDAFPGLYVVCGRSYSTLILETGRNYCIVTLCD